MYSWTLITGDTPVTTDARSFRQSLGTFPTGVCLVTTVSTDGKCEGMTINSFASVSLDPPLILWSIRDDARSADAFIGGRHFILSVLAASQRQIALHFARPARDKFAAAPDYSGVLRRSNARHTRATRRETTRFCWGASSVTRARTRLLYSFTWVRWAH
jgi:Flavin reductase like domain